MYPSSRIFSSLKYSLNRSAASISIRRSANFNSFQLIQFNSFKHFSSKSDSNSSDSPSISDIELSIARTYRPPSLPSGSTLIYSKIPSRAFRLIFYTGGVQALGSALLYMFEKSSAAQLAEGRLIHSLESLLSQAPTWDISVLALCGALLNLFARYYGNRYITAIYMHPDNHHLTILTHSMYGPPNELVIDLSKIKPVGVHHMNENDKEKSKLAGYKIIKIAEKTGNYIFDLEGLMINQNKIDRILTGNWSLNEIKFDKKK